jgi:galactokinase
MSADVATLEQHATALAARLASEGRPLFTGPEAPLLARAPGRLDVMGGIGDYSGSLTLEMPIAEAAFVAVQRVEGDRVRVVSAGFGKAPGPLRDVSFPLAELAPACESHAAARRLFAREPASAWAAYVAGALAALRVEHGVRVGTGLDILVCSSVPEGKGVSSSAAIEVASLLALAALAGLPLEPVQVALACQRVENLVVGAACGAMDQLTAACGSEGQLLPILCQPAQLEPALPIPPGLRFWGIDSGVRHAVSGSGYTDVRVAAFMGYTLIARALGIPLRGSGQSGKLVADDTLFRGYLANVGVERFERELSARLPEQLSGAAFLREHEGIIDPVTEVAPDRTYRVRAATAHPIHEHARVTEFCSLLQSAGEAAAPRLGSLMYGAHASYGACGLGAAGTDRLVELVRAAGPARGLHGAKITGGGSGGTVAVLGSRDALPAVLEVVDRYARETGLEPQLFSGSSPGAASFGIRRLLRESAGYRVSGRVDGIAVASRSGGT